MSWGQHAAPARQGPASSPRPTTGSCHCGHALRGPVEARGWSDETHGIRAAPRSGSRPGSLVLLGDISERACEERVAGHLEVSSWRGPGEPLREGAPSAGERPVNSQRTSSFARAAPAFALSRAFNGVHAPGTSQTPRNEQNKPKLKPQRTASHRLDIWTPRRTLAAKTRSTDFPESWKRAFTNRNRKQSYKRATD